MKLVNLTVLALAGVAIGIGALTAISGYAEADSATRSSDTLTAGRPRSQGSAADSRQRTTTTPLVHLPDSRIIQRLLEPPASLEKGEGYILETQEQSSPGHPNLDAILDLAPEDAKRTLEIVQQVGVQLAEDPAVEIVSGRCILGFCRIVLFRPLDSVLDWQAVDEKLATVATGMTWMKATPNAAGGTSAHIYFAQGEEELPL